MRYIGFGLVCFYGLSTIVGYFIRNHVYSFTLDKSTKLNSSKFTNKSIKYQALVYTQLNDQKLLF